MRRRFFVDEVRSGKAEISGDDARHLTRVLRVEPASATKSPTIAACIWRRSRRLAKSTWSFGRSKSLHAAKQDGGNYSLRRAG